MKTRHVGGFALGPDRVAVDLVAGINGANFRQRPLEARPLVIEVGYTNDWPWLLVRLHHEVLELGAMRMALRYSNDALGRHDATACSFHMSHLELSELSERVAKFMVDCQPVLRKVWAKWTK